MKHVFVINSHTTFLTSRGTIELLHINEDDVVMLYTRSYRNSIVNVKNVRDVTEESDYCEEYVLKNKYYNKKCISLIDAVVEDSIRDVYELYVPHMQLKICQLLYTNRKCLRVSYIQEAGYPQPKKFLTRLSLEDIIKNIIYYLFFQNRRAKRVVGWYQPHLLNKQKTINSYAVNPNFFQQLPSKNHVVKWPSFTLNIDFKSNGVFFVFDGFVKNGIIEKDFYLNACNYIIQKYAGVHNYLKFHPGQSQSEKDFIKKCFIAIDCDINILDDSIPFEVIISSFSNLVIVGFSSSLLKFASDLGHTVYANDDLLKKSEKYQQHICNSGFPYMCDLLEKNGCY